MSKLAWLHLSDIHFLPTNDWSDSTARADLLDYLAKQLLDHNIKVELIFCTGDIAFGQLPTQTLDAQYTMARSFFDDVLKVCQCDKSRLFVVPGNHDIDRGSITNAVRLAWQGWGEDDKSRTMLNQIPAWFAAFNADVKDAMRRLEAYGQFVQDYLPHQHNAADGHWHHAQMLDINGLKVGITGFNSAWTCAGDEDDRRLWLAAGPQFDFMRRKLKGADLKIGLIHHPLDWFNVAERSVIKQRIADEADFWLHGHTHDAWVEPLPTHVVLGAGAVTAYEESEFGCNLVELDLAAQNGVARLYRYNQKKARWLRATDVTPKDDGLWPFALPQRVRPPAPHVVAPPPLVVTPPPSAPVAPAAAPPSAPPPPATSPIQTPQSGPPSHWLLETAGRQASLRHLGSEMQALCYIPRGEFIIGSPEAESGRGSDEGPQHKVVLAGGFWLADTACTQALWQSVMGHNPSRFTPGKGGSLQHPVEKVSWLEVQIFLHKLQAHLPGWRVTLPTEAEWEYACRAGSLTAFYFGDTLRPEQAHFDADKSYPGAPAGPCPQASVAVKAIAANAWGLYQMHGNVWEWCANAKRDYATGVMQDPGLEQALAGGGEGAAQGLRRVVRGGSWRSEARFVRSACRAAEAPDSYGSDVGFRFVLRPDAKPQAT
jgi:formylglycine-generating enzyme required for sulfatase activity/predicted phosphodiesterase